MCEINAFIEWKSLFTDEAKIIWQQEPKEFRKVAMLFLTLRHEFKKLEDDLESNLKKYKETVKTDSTPLKDLASNIQNIQSPKREIAAVKEEFEFLLESPKLNKHRTSNNVPDSPSLLRIISKSSQKVDSILVESSCSESEEFKTYFKPKNLFKMGKSNGSEDENMIDSSFVINETPKTVAKIAKPAKEIKWMSTKKRKHLKQSTITKMLAKSPKIRKTTNCVNEQNDDTDKTFFAPLERQNKFSLPNCKLSKFADYDVVPVAKDTAPKYPHKTDRVSKKSERLKLPGWSCEDCKRFYEFLDLSPNSLKKKMDMCSKHRNKFAPESATPEGFWDLTMPPTQD